MTSPDWDADESHQAEDAARDKAAGQSHPLVVVDAALRSMVSKNQLFCRRCGEVGSGADYNCLGCGEQRQCWDALLIRFQGLDVTMEAIKHGIVAKGFPAEWIRNVNPVMGSYGASRGMAIVVMENVAAATAVLAMCKFIDVRTATGTSAKLRLDRDGRRLFAARPDRRGAQQEAPKPEPFAPQWSSADELQRILDAVFSEWQTASDPKKDFYNAHIPILNDLRYKEREQQEAIEAASAVAQPVPADLVPPPDPQEAAAAPSSANATEVAKSALQDRLAKLREQKKKADPPPTTTQEPAAPGAFEKAGTLTKPTGVAAPPEPSRITALKPIPYPPALAFNNYVSGRMETRRYDQLPLSDPALEMTLDMWLDARATLRSLVEAQPAASS